MRRSILIIFTALGFLYSSFAQTGSTYSADLPKLLPASPEVSTFLKASVGNTNLSTGALNASIPLYEVKVRDYKFPISLSYTTQGLKADEASSRVGLGWVLNATGMISRIVRGKPDEKALYLHTPPDFSANTDQVYNYLSNATDPNSGYDSQPDEFQFSCNGYSGKFVLDSNYVPRITSTSNIKIEVEITVAQLSSEGNIGIITLTTPDGIKYQFGSHFERTVSHNISQYVKFNDRTKTAFFLDHIDLPTGEYIEFNYSPISTKAITGITQTLKLGKQYNTSQSCSDCSTLNSYTNQEDRIDYQTQYLTGISTSNGLNISFSYETRPDLSNDIRLKQLNVQGHKLYVFDYYDIPGTSTDLSNAKTMGRFFLTKVREIKQQDVIDLNQSYNYELQYNDLANVPLPITFAQDYLGYYNGRISNNELIPPAYNSNNGTAMDFSYRDPIFQYAKKGTLSSIVYPTGGKEEYVYESNTIAQINLRNTFVFAEVAGNGSASGPAVYNYSYITPKRNHTATLNVSADDAILNDGYSTDASHVTAVVRLYEGTSLIASRSVLGYSSNSTSVNLLAGHNYKLELTVNQAGDRGFGSVYYDTASYPIYDTINVEVPGVRVRQIKYTSGATNTTHSKFYTYSTLERLDLSTGSCPPVYFRTDLQGRNYCGQFNEFQRDCTIETYSSSSTSDVYSYAGSSSIMYYNRVIESNDPNFSNGGTEYTFFENDNGSNDMVLLGSTIPFLPGGQNPTLSGVISKTRVFDNNKKILQEDDNTYETIIYLDNAGVAYNVLKRYNTYIYTADRMDAYDVNKLLYGNYWIRLKMKTTKVYNGAGVITQSTNYNYGAPVNILPASIITLDSKGQQLKTDTKYPTDYPSDPVLSKLVTKNIIIPIVDQASYKAGSLLQQKQIVYKDWFNDSKVLEPEIIRIKQSESDLLHDAVITTQYDDGARPLQLQKKDDIQTVYLWDKVHSVPLCEIKNANFNQVAFCSFEDPNNYGNLQFTSGNVNTFGFTGSHCFSGSLYKSISTSGTYIVTLWTNSSATINNNAGSIIRTAQGWSLYKWILSNPSTITISGTNMDDIRIYPINAFVTSYTYKPFVGITSMTDPNNTVFYYDYDYMDRLYLVRDVESKILKKYCYNYYGDKEDCGMDKNPKWQITNVTRCKPCPSNSNYISNIQQHQEKDSNPYSTTYNTLRWIDDGVSSSCVPQADWQLQSFTCQLNTSGKNTGYQVRTEKDINPCSSTYNTTRQVTVYNTTSCPLPVTCSTSNCSGADRKCVNGACEVGCRVNTSSVYTKINNPAGDPPQIWVWRCTYHYVWSDGSVSPNYTEDNQTSCSTTNNCTGLTGM